MNLIKVQNLVKDYTNEGVTTPVLHGLNFAIDSGEFVAIMGPSGSGQIYADAHFKLFRPRHGGLYELKAATPKIFPIILAELRNERVGFVFQSFNLLARTSVLDNVKLPLIYSKKKEPGRACKKALESVGLSHRLEYFTNQISGGGKTARGHCPRPGLRAGGNFCR